MKLQTGNSRALRHDSLEEVRLPIMLVVTLGAALAVALALKHALPVEAVLPALVILMFAAAAFIGFAGFAAGRSMKQSIFDIAGVFTFVGVFIAAAVEPEQMVGLMESVRTEK
jgi:hypothetical protein